MPTNNKKYGRRIKGTRNLPVIADAVAPAPPDVANDDINNESVPFNPYKKMKVMECRVQLMGKDVTISDMDGTISRLMQEKTVVTECRAQQEAVSSERDAQQEAIISERDEQISRLMQELESSKQQTKMKMQQLESSKQHSKLKEATIRQKTDLMLNMSKDLQNRRRECNDMLAEQRAASDLTKNDSEKRIRSIRQDCNSTMSTCREEADINVLAAELARDAAVSDAKRTIMAERQFCQELRRQRTKKVNEKLFDERVVTVAATDAMANEYDKSLSLFQDINTKSKTALTEQKKLLTELEVKHKSSARLERQHHSQKIVAKNAVIKKLEKEHQGRMNFMVTTCAQLVNDNVEAAADAAKSDAVASSAMEISSVPRTFGRIRIDFSGAMGQSKVNKDFGRGHEAYASRGRVKEVTNKKQGTIEKKRSS